MYSKLICAVALILPITALTAPAQAMTGRAAVGVCIDRGAACKHSRHIDGSIEIEVTNDGVTTVVTCPSATAECKIARRGGSAPKGSVEQAVKGTPRALGQ